jgi:glycosyltransferase involved in cell wall biosynthesis
LRISIITINYNNSLGLEKTIKSVLYQTYKLIEYIIVDGASTDSSQVVIDKYKSNISYALSEGDNGIYNAMNKGIKLATGDYILFLNSGDVLNNNKAIESVVEFKCTEDLVICDMAYVDNNERHVWVPEDKLTFDALFHKSIPHPSTLIKRKLFDSIGLYDESLKIVSDWKFFMLAICKYSCSYRRLRIILAEFEGGGISNDPNNYPLISEEKELVISEHFSAFITDYAELHAARKQLRKLRNIIRIKNLFRLKR